LIAKNCVVAVILAQHANSLIKMEPEPEEHYNNNVVDDNDDDVPPIPEPVDVLANICDGVVSEGTLASYINDALAFVKWYISLGNEEFNCLMAFGRAQVTTMLECQPGECEGGCPFTIHVWSTFKALLCNAHIQPIIHLDCITADGFMKYVLSLQHPK